MGRQISFHALPEDLSMLIQYAKSQNPVVVCLKVGDAPVLDEIERPEFTDQVLILWNLSLCPTLKRKRIRGGRQGYRVDDQLPVLELSPSRLVTWDKYDALVQGRLYGFDFKGNSPYYQSWYESLARWVRRNFTKCKANSVDGYIGPAAERWYTKGGVLLPIFVPPLTPEWRASIESQHAIG